MKSFVQLLVSKRLESMLSSLDYARPIVVDYETISFDDEKEATKPYNGCRISAVGFCQDYVTHTFAIRHRDESKDCDDIDEVRTAMQFVFDNAKVLVGQNIKFEGHFSNVEPLDMTKPEWHDTMVLGRLVYNDHESYSLDALTERYCEKYKKQGAAVAEWIEKHPTKDYGRVPLDILIPYLCDDLRSTEELYYVLLGRLPEDCVDEWKTECEFLKNVWRIEAMGLHIDKKYLTRQKIIRLQEMITQLAEIQRVVGWNINPNSSDQLETYFASVGITSPIKTEKGKPSWDKNALAQTIHPVADLCLKFSKSSYALSMFIDGWMERADENNLIHPTFWISGARSNRVTSSEPNAQNYPPWVEHALLIPAGHVGIKWDWSQIEYRVFIHYGAVAEKIQSYVDNPDIDAHQLFADLLGLPRKPVKSLNFGVIFSMGVKKLKKSIAKDIASLVGSMEEKTIARMKYYALAGSHMPAYCADAGIQDGATRATVDALSLTHIEKVIVAGEQIPPTVLEEIAANILTEYHQQSPEIKHLQKIIKSAVYARGYVRNFHGRRYYLKPDKSYVGLNRIVQGTAAGAFKRACNAIMREAPAGTQLYNNIHDAVLVIVPIEQAQAYYDAAKRITEDSPFKVPLRADFEVAYGNWGCYTKIENGDVISSLAKLYKSKKLTP